MEKFLSIPVLDADGTNSQNQLVGITGILDITQASNTQVNITYVGGKVTRLDYPVADATFIGLEGAYSAEVQDAVAAALNSGWTHVVHQYNPKGFIAGTPVPKEPGSAANTNPLAAISFA